MAIYNGREVTLLNRINTPDEDRIKIEDVVTKDVSIASLSQLELTQEEIRDYTKRLLDTVIQPLENKEKLRKETVEKEKKLEKEQGVADKKAVKEDTKAPWFSPLNKNKQV